VLSVVTSPLLQGSSDSPHVAEVAVETRKNAFKNNGRLSAVPLSLINCAAHGHYMESEEGRLVFVPLLSRSKRMACKAED
jgi:hypothetical protein